ncbi:MAG: indole-3-glycerol phosphate synthase TrpC [Caulobacterales bacterium]
MSDVLEHILTYKREEIIARRRLRPEPVLQAELAAQAPARGFEAALRRAAATRAAIIAEIKRASPSKGLIRADFEPAALARAYEAGGAACLSVLTDGPSFQGEDAHLVAARAAASLPALRKDFFVDPYQVLEARTLGADAVLVILAACDDALALDLTQTARALGMDVLAEVHDADELERALRLPTPLVGINNRSLRTFETRLETFEALAAGAPREVLLVAESGIFTRADIDRLARAGAGAYLIGESLMRQDDVAAAVAALAHPATS